MSDLDFDALEKEYKKRSKGGKVPVVADDLDFDVLEKAHQATQSAQEQARRNARPSYLDIGQAKLPFDVGATLQERFNNPNQPAPSKQSMPGDQPKLYAEGDPNARAIAMDASIASAARAETPEEKATRNFNGLMAGTQKVPFFPHVRGAVAGGLAGLQGQPMGPAYEAEVANARQQIGEAAERAPAAALVGEAGSAMALPGALPAKTGLGRALGGAGIGAVYGAGAADRPGATAGDYLTGAAIGAPIGIAGALGGEGLRPLFRGASGREDKAFMRELTRANAGEGQMAMLAKNKEGILKDYERIVALRRDPEIRNAVKMKEGEGIPIIDERLAPLRDAQDARYAKIDEAVAHPFNQGQMTPQRLMGELDAAKRAASSPDVAYKIDNIQKDLQSHWLPNIWGDDPKAVIPSREFRRWLTSVQGSAANTPGALNWTNTYASTEEAARAAKGIFNRYLDGANLPKVTDELRRDNATITTLLHVRGAMEAKAKKETLAQVGLGAAMEDQGRKLELGAAGAAAVSGHPEAAAVILARPYVGRAIDRTAGWVNRAIVEPMQQAAEAGAAPAQLARFAVERGVPQGVADSMAARASSMFSKPAGQPEPPRRGPTSWIEQAFQGQEPAPQSPIERMRTSPWNYARIGQ